MNILITIASFIVYFTMWYQLIFNRTFDDPQRWSILVSIFVYKFAMDKYANLHFSKSVKEEETED
jgi:hypothetical protein